MADKDPLADIRQRIDEIDIAVQQLVSERAECARKVAEVKREQGDTEHFYRPEREAQVLRKVQQRNRGRYLMMRYPASSVKSWRFAWRWKSL